jgi:hypothetical protein
LRGTTWPLFSSTTSRTAESGCRASVSSSTSSSSFSPPAYTPISSSLSTSTLSKVRFRSQPRKADCFLEACSDLSLLIAIYYLSSFFNQFGPNSTTFLLAAEVYPTSIRATAHGLSAACGKLGALLPAIIYNYTETRTKFWIVTWFGLAGFLLTVLVIPDTTGQSWSLSPIISPLLI